MATKPAVAQQETTSQEPSGDNAELAALLQQGEANSNGAPTADDADDDLLEGDDADLGEDDEPAETPNAKAKAPQSDDDSTAETEAAADEADTAAEPDAELDEEDQGVRAKFTPEQQQKFDRAVSKKTRRILELKTEVSEERAERERLAVENEELRKTTASSPAAQPTAENPLADIADEAKLDEKLSTAKKLRRFALSNPDGAFVDQKTGEIIEVADPENPPDGAVAFSKKRIGEILAETEEMLQEHGPKHRQFLQQRNAAEAEAVKTFPWLKNKSSTGYQAVETTLRAAPQLRSIPGIKHLLADAFIGRAVRLGAGAKKEAGSAAAGPGQRKAPPSPGGGMRPPKIDGKRKLAGSALETVAATGDDPDNAALRALIRNS